MDTHLLAEMADLRPEWQFVMIGPVVKIAPEDLPRRSNIHYLGGKDYNELPAYLSGWDVALMPFAMNESTKYISPTKTPEYLAAGKCVISTPIRDVVRPYGERKTGLRLRQRRKNLSLPLIKFSNAEISTNGANGLMSF